MTIQELHMKIHEILAKNPEAANSPIMFDTEAKTFQYHLARISKCFLEHDVFAPDEYTLILHE